MHVRASRIYNTWRKLNFSDPQKTASQIIFLFDFVLSCEFPCLPFSNRFAINDDYSRSLQTLIRTATYTNTRTYYEHTYICVYERRGNSVQRVLINSLTTQPAKENRIIMNVHGVITIDERDLKYSNPYQRSFSPLSLSLIISRTRRCLSFDSEKYIMPGSESRSESQ